VSVGHDHKVDSDMEIDYRVDSDMEIDPKSLSKGLAGVTPIVDSDLEIDPKSLSKGLAGKTTDLATMDTMKRT
jgi:hypothetical protein